MENLTPNTTSHFRLYVAPAGKDVIYGPEYRFTTLVANNTDVGKVHVSTMNASSVTFVFDGSAGGSNVPYTCTEQGICYSSVYECPSLLDSHQAATSTDSVNPTTMIVTGLKPGTLYYFRKYAIINGVVHYNGTGSTSNVTTRK